MKLFIQYNQKTVDKIITDPNLGTSEERWSLTLVLSKYWMR